MTLVDNKNASTAIRTSVKSILFNRDGFTFRQLRRIGNVAIYEQTKKGQSPAYEVVILRMREARIAFGMELPECEHYPSSEEWGTYGWTYRSLSEAERKFKELNR